MLKLSPRTYFLIAGISAVLFAALLYLGSRFWSYALGAGIGAVLRGFYEENKISKSLGNKN